MILTFKVRHERNFSIELVKARQIAEFALKTRTLSSRDVKQFGLKSVIANQILRKYSRNKKLKRISSVKLTVPSQSIHVEGTQLRIPCLKLSLPVSFRKTFSKVNQIEFDDEYAYVSVTMPEAPLKQVVNWMGVDRNATGHVVVAANPASGKVWKLGKSAKHIHEKYDGIRKKLQKAGKYKKAKSIRDRESRIVRDLNHKISKKLVDLAEQSNSGIKLERLEGIRRNKKYRRRFNGVLHSWSFRQLQNFLEYKAKLRGIPIAYVEPRNTSKECSRCGSIGTRIGKRFVCPRGHVDHADANAGFNIALRLSIGQSNIDRDMLEGSTDAPKGATL